MMIAFQNPVSFINPLVYKHAQQAQTLLKMAHAFHVYNVKMQLQ